MITLRVFLSSTFKDMAAERDELVRRRFPALRAWAEGLGVHLVEVDLRWGVTNPSSLDACLTEVDECRPLFLCFLGHHFGSPVSPKALTGEILARYGWISPEKHLECSYTELEIIHAALREDTPPMESLFYFRDARFSAEVEGRLGMTNEHAASQESLKERIRRSGLPLREGYINAEQLGDWVEKDLRRVIAARAAAIPPGAAWASRRGRRWAGDAAMLDELSSAVHRHWQPGLFRRLTRGSSRGGVIVTGAAGCGKSTLLAAWARMISGERVQITAAGTAHEMPGMKKLRELRPAMLCLSAEDDPPGRPEEGVIAWPRLAWRLMEFIRRTWAPDLTLPCETEPMALLHALPGALERIPATERLLVVIDGLDLLPDRSRTDALAWLPEALPAQVCIAAGIGSGAAELAARRGWDLKMLPDRPPREVLGHWLAACLAEYGKYFTPEQSAKAESLLAQVPARWTGLVLADLRSIGVRRLLMPRLEALADAAADAGRLGRLLLEGLARRQGARLVWRALALLMEARTGLFEMEWRALLRPPDLETLPGQAWSPAYHALRDWLQPSSGVQAPTPELRLAWEAWLATRPREVVAKRLTNARARLEEYFSALGSKSASALEQLPWLCRDSPGLLQRLLSPPWLGALWRDRAEEVRLLWRLLDDDSFARVMAQWDAQFINLDADGWHALAEEAMRRHGRQPALTAARRAQELGAHTAALTEAMLLRRGNRQTETIACLSGMTGRTDAAEPAVSQARLLLAEILFENGDLTGAADCARAALDSASKRGEPGLWMQACDLLGNLLLAGDSPSQALPFFQELERLAGLTGARRQRIVALKGTGDALAWVKGKRAEAIRTLREAIEAAARAGDSDLHQSALGSLVNVLRDEPGGIVEASTLVIERLALVKKMGDPAAEAQALFQYGRICHDRGESDRAHHHFQQSLVFARQTGQTALARECKLAIEEL